MAFGSDLGRVLSARSSLPIAINKSKNKNSWCCHEETRFWVCRPVVLFSCDVYLDVYRAAVVLVQVGVASPAQLAGAKLIILTGHNVV